MYIYMVNELCNFFLNMYVVYISIVVCLYELLLVTLLMYNVMYLQCKTRFNTALITFSTS